ncbi:hypothetical protein Hdeb2414_s0032g00711531 [Helianthus debilis subsp. tardiflorus]
MAQVNKLRVSLSDGNKFPPKKEMKGRRRGRGKITVLLHIAIHITNHVFLMTTVDCRRDLGRVLSKAT